MVLPEIGHGQAELGANRSIKSVSKARNIAMTNTVVSVVTGVLANRIFKNETARTAGAYLAVYGLISGPSSGNFYAEDYLRGGLGAISRVGIGSLLLLDSTRELMGKDIAQSLGWDNRDTDYTDTKLLVGAGLFVGSIIYNVISAKYSVQEHNARMGYSLDVRTQNITGRSYPAITANIQF